MHCLDESVLGREYWRQLILQMVVNFFGDGLCQYVEGRFLVVVVSFFGVCQELLQSFGMMVMVISSEMGRGCEYLLYTTVTYTLFG